MKYIWTDSIKLLIPAAVQNMKKYTHYSLYRGLGFSYPHIHYIHNCSSKHTPWNAKGILFADLRYKFHTQTSSTILLQLVGIHVHYQWYLSAHLSSLIHIL